MSESLNKITLALLCLISIACSENKNLNTKIHPEHPNLSYPASLEAAALKAYRHFPELHNNEVTIRISDNFSSAFMQAQPLFVSFFQSRKGRSYLIKVRPTFEVDDRSIALDNIPDTVMTGWLGHEMGHLIDYSHRSNLNLLWLGFRYLLSKRAIVSVERQADLFAIQHGMGDYILATKEFILEKGRFPKWYTDKMRKFYLSPEDIRQVIRKDSLKRAEKAKL